MLNAVEFNAMLSYGGIKDVRVVLVDASTAEKDTQLQIKWDGISSRNDFSYANRTVTNWRAYKAGLGKHIEGMQCMLENIVRAAKHILPQPCSPPLSLSCLFIC